MAQTPKGSRSKVALYLMILASLVIIGLIGYVVAAEPLYYLAISNITSVLITVTGILLGLSALLPVARSLERIKLQVTFTLVTILWLALVIVIAQTAFNPFLYRGFFPDIQAFQDVLRYLFLAGIGLFTIVVVIYSTAIVEATRQRLVAEQAARESMKAKSS